MWVSGYMVMLVGKWVGMSVFGCLGICVGMWASGYMDI